MTTHIGSSLPVTLLGAPSVRDSTITALDGPIYSEGLITQPLGAASRLRVTYTEGLGLYLGLTQGGVTPTDIEHGLHINIEGKLFSVQQSESQFIRNCQPGDVLSLHHDGVAVRMSVNGVKVKTQAGRIGNWQGLLLLNGSVDAFEAASFESVALGGLYNGEAETGDLAGWRNITSDQTASGKLEIVSEACSGDFCFAMTRQGPGVCSMQSRAFPVSSGDIYGGFFNSRADTPEGSITYSFITGNTIDPEGFLIGETASSDLFTLALGQDWHGGSGTVRVPTIHRFGAVVIKSSTMGSSRFLIDNVTFSRALPFVASGNGSPDLAATNGGNMIVNASLEAGGDGLLGISLPSGIIRKPSSVTDKGRYHLVAQTAGQLFLNYTSEARFPVDDLPLTCGAYVSTAPVSFLLECFDNDGSLIGQDEALLTPASGWGWVNASLQPMSNTASARISVMMQKNAKMAGPQLMRRLRGAVDILGDDALRLRSDMSSQIYNLGVTQDNIVRVGNSTDPLFDISTSYVEAPNELITPRLSSKNNLDITARRGIALLGQSIELFANDSPIFRVNEGGVSFSTTLAQMINLDGPKYGIGVQTDTTYLRTAYGFAVHQGGVHSPYQSDSGGGQTLLDVTPQDIRYLDRSIAPRVILQGFHSGVLPPQSIVWGTISPETFTLSEENSMVRSTKVCSRDTVLSVMLNGSPFGLIRFTLGGTLGELIVNDSHVVPAKSHLTVMTAISPDDSLTDITFLISE